MPRPYRLGQRKASAEETRARIIAGARELLLSEDGFKHFTIDAIARQSDVARMTVYYQFQSKAGIFEAMADDVAERGEIRKNAAAAFTCEDPREGVAKLIYAFVHFWLSDPEVMRKLHALSILDPESQAAERDAWRLEAIETMMARLRKQYGLPGGSANRRHVEVLYLLTSFGSVEGLARHGRSERQIVSTICEAAGAEIGLDFD